MTGFDATTTDAEVRIPAGAVTLPGNLTIPPEARGIVMFAHGSGSSRHSPRNQFVAEQLQTSGLATLLFDLLTESEEQVDQFTGHLRFDTELLSNRLVHAAAWLADTPDTSDLAVGCFGASTGGGAALVAAAQIPDRIRAVVSRGGRPDLAGQALERVRAPTLLIVGGNDPTVLKLNRQAFAMLAASEKQLAIIPGATHLFEEPGALEEVARLAADWFGRYLTARAG